METALMELEKCRTSGDGMEQEEIPVKVGQEGPVDSTTTKLDGAVKNSTKPTRLPPTQSRRRESVHVQEHVHTRKTSAPVGHEGLDNNKVGQELTLPGLHTLYRRPERVTRSVAPVVPKGELVALKPRLVTPLNTLPEHKKTKPPKFVPYEPYPGAVNPIVPRPYSGTTVARIVGQKPLSRNNLDIGILVSQMSTMRTQELSGKDNGKESTGNSEHSSDEMTNNDEAKVIQELKEELRKVREERDHYQGQFKFQTQVNSELKNLLVASVGEDLLTRVNVLTEDKLQLARALLDTANNLTTHTEQIEFLAGQCEVWRSKFLACSVMVEELARWKADLTQKNQMLNESIKQLLETISQLRSMQLEMLKNLKFLAKIRYLNLPAIDVMSLSAENVNILQQMVLHSGVGMPEGNLNISSASTSTLCEAERYAVRALEFISQPLMATDEAIHALFGQAQRPYNNNPKSKIPDETTSEKSLCSEDKN